MNFEAPTATDPGVANAQKLMDIERRLASLERKKDLIVTPLDIPVEIEGSGNGSYFASPVWTGGRFYVCLLGYTRRTTGSGGLVQLKIELLKPDGNYDDRMILAADGSSASGIGFPGKFLEFNSHFSASGIKPGPVVFRFSNIGTSTTVVKVDGFFIEWPTA